MLASACGKIARAPSSALTMEGARLGCLNDVGSRVRGFTDGSIDEASWRVPWDCASNGLEQFVRYVRGASPDGYTPEELQAFVSAYLYTSKPLPLALVRAGFELKASLLGGSASLLTASEIRALEDLISAAERESALLLPALATHSRGGSDSAALLSFSHALGDGIARFSAHLGADGAAPLRWSAVECLANETANLLDFELTPGLLPSLHAMKPLLVGGAADILAPGEWPALARAGGALLSPVAALLGRPLTGLGPLPVVTRLIDELFAQARVALESSIDAHGGMIPYSELDSLFRALPAERLPVDAATIHAITPPLFTKILRSGSPDGITRASISLLGGVLHSWAESERNLDAIFAQGGLDEAGVSTRDFVDAAGAYAASLDAAGQDSVERLIYLAEHYRPLFEAGEMQILFTRREARTRQQLSQLSWMRLIAESLLRGYSKGPDPLRATQAEFVEFFDDFKPLGVAIHQTEPDRPTLGVERFRDADMFMYSSNGDGMLDVDEGTYFVAYAVSQADELFRIEDLIHPWCKPVGGVDSVGSELMDIGCFRERFFGRYDEHFTHFPRLQTYYSGLAPGERDELRVAIENAARRKGSTEDPIGRVDLSGLTGILHYVETMALRFDSNDDGVIDLDELRPAFPVFKGELAQIAGVDGSQNGLLWAAFTYTCHAGHPPKKGTAGTADLLAWWAEKPFWKVRMDRLGLYGLIGAISQLSQTKPPAPAPAR